MLIITESILAFCGSFLIVYYFLICMKSIGVTVDVSRNFQQFIFLFYCLLSTGLSFLGNGFINLIVLFFALFISYFFIHRGKIYFLFDITLLIALYFTDTLLTLGIRSVVQNGTYFSTKSSLHPLLFYFTIVLCVRMLEMIVLKTLTFFMKKNLTKELLLKHFFMSLIFPIFSLFNLFSMFLFLEIFPSMSHMILFLFNIFLFLLFHLFFIYFLHTMTKNSTLQNEISFLQKQQEIQSAYYTTLEQKYDRTRQLRHDMRNHIQALQHLDTELEKEYLHHMQSALYELSMQYYTNNKMLNIILNDKGKQMQSLFILFKTNIADVDLSFLRPMDITTIFANLLDNAIEAAKDSIEASVSLKITQNHNFISITIQNTFTKQPTTSKKGLLSQKPHHKGLGLKNVSQVIASYHGDFQYEWSDTYFITRILLTC